MNTNHGIFLLQADGELIEMQERTYDSEALLQNLIARYPNLLAGNQIDSVTPRRWLLIAREMSLPADEGGANRWAVDHLFLDQDAIPTIVEVKRSTDTRIRREVVGQMLDYAANAVVYWPIERLRSTFETTCTVQGRDPAEELAAFLENGADNDFDTFWQRAKTNLQAGRVRLVFVADEIPAELRRIVEFLNEQMDPAEVLAVEIKQYVGQELKTLVPRVIGQTAETQRKKTVATSPRRKWDGAQFMEELGARRGKAEVEIAQAILSWARSRGLRIWWGEGKKDGSFFPMLDLDGVTHWLIAVWTYGRVEVQFQQMKVKPFDGHEKRIELRNRLNTIPGIAILPDTLDRRPSFPLSTLNDPAARQQFLSVLDWFLQEARSTLT